MDKYKDMQHYLKKKKSRNYPRLILSEIHEPYIYAMNDFELLLSVHLF